VFRYHSDRRNSSHHQMPYADFIMAVRRNMIAMKGDNFTIELLWSLDGSRRPGCFETARSHNRRTTNTRLWLTTLSLALAHQRWKFHPDALRITGLGLSIRIPKIFRHSGGRKPWRLLVDAPAWKSRTRKYDCHVEEKYPVQQYVCGAPEAARQVGGSEQI
jgi:hypothetical protein